MPQVGDNVLVAVPAGNRPYVFVGTVIEVYGPYGFSLFPVVMIPYAGTGTWPQLAANENDARASMRTRVYADPVEIGGNRSYITKWRGEVPTSNQN